MFLNSNKGITRIKILKTQYKNEIKSFFENQKSTKSSLCNHFLINTFLIFKKGLNFIRRLGFLNFDTFNHTLSPDFFQVYGFEVTNELIV